MSLRLIFMGTPDFSVPALTELVARGYDIAAVYTRVPKPGGRRGLELQPTPVERAARGFGLPVLTPATLKTAEAQAAFRVHGADAAVVVAYGLILPKPVLEAVPLGAFNIHASLLPRWRGAAPIAAAIAAGDSETGIAIQQMEAGLDTGPVFASRRTPIGREESAGDLTRRLSKLGAELLCEVVAAMEAGLLKPAPQSEAGASYAPKLEGLRGLELSRNAEALAREVRAFGTEPGTTLEARGERVKVMQARAGSESSREEPGSVIGVRGDALRLAAGDGSVFELVRVQRPGGKPISGRDLANGLRLSSGEKLE